METVKIKGNKLSYALGAGTGKTYSVPAGVEIIAPSAFSHNEVLEEILLPDGLKEIGDMAFLGCVRLKSVRIPPSVKTVGSRVFEGCSKLENIYVDDMSSAEYGADCWSKCSSLKEIHCGDETARVIYFPVEDTMLICVPLANTESGVDLFVGKYAGHHFPNDHADTPPIYVAFAKDVAGKEYWWYSLIKEDAVEGAYLQANHETIRQHFGHLGWDTKLNFREVAQICGFCIWGMSSWCDVIKVAPDEKKTVREIMDLMVRCAPGAARRFAFVLEHQDEDLGVLALENHMTTEMLLAKYATKDEKLTIKW